MKFNVSLRRLQEQPGWVCKLFTLIIAKLENVKMCLAVYRNECFKKPLAYFELRMLSA